MTEVYTSRIIAEYTVYPKKYAHGFVVLCFVVVMQSFIMNSHEVFIHIHQGCFAGTGAIVRLPQCQWSKPDGYGKISQCITTTKHSKAKTVCIFLGIYCRLWPNYVDIWNLLIILHIIYDWYFMTYFEFALVSLTILETLHVHIKCEVIFAVEEYSQNFTMRRNRQFSLLSNWTWERGILILLTTGIGAAENRFLCAIKGACIPKTWQCFWKLHSTIFPLIEFKNNAGWR